MLLETSVSAGVDVLAALGGVQVVGGVRDAVAVGVRQPGLFAVCAGQPAQVVVEGTVLHHHDHDVVDAGVPRRR